MTVGVTEDFERAGEETIALSSSASHRSRTDADLTLTEDVAVTV